MANDGDHRYSIEKSDVCTILLIISYHSETHLPHDFPCFCLHVEMLKIKKKLISNQSPIQLCQLSYSQPSPTPPSHPISMMPTTPTRLIHVSIVKPGGKGKEREAESRIYTLEYTVDPKDLLQRLMLKRERKNKKRHLLKRQNLSREKERGGYEK